MKTVERIEDVSLDGGEGLLAIIVRDEFRPEGVTFFTEPDANQQVGYIRHPLGTVIKRHRHVPYERTINGTTEVLIVKRGILEVKLYNSRQDYIATRVLASGDVLILMQGGHEFRAIDGIELVEVKQGPYTEKTDKIHF